MGMQLARIVFIGVPLELIWIASTRLGPLREHTMHFLALMFTAFVLCLWTYFRVPIQAGKTVRLVLGFAALFRLTVVFAPPHQSEDVYRYLWDARVASMGINPYKHPPDATEIEGIRDGVLYPAINSKPYITAYPPLSQLLFRLSYALFGIRVAGMKAVFSLLEFMAVIVAWRLLIEWNRSLQSLVLMAWNPFFVFEFSYSGHSDGAMMFLVLLSVFLLCRSKKTWAAASYAGAVMVKLHPALWFPLFVRRAGRKSAVAAIATGIGLMLLYFNMETWLRYLNSLSLYFRLFEFNASIHYLIRFIGHLMFQQSWDKIIGPWLGAVLLLIVTLIAWRYPMHDARDLLHAGFWIMVADLCLATTVHPWYLSWAALALPFFPYAFVIYWTGACFLSYVAYAYRPVYEPAWALLLEYLPMYALMAWEIRRRAPATEEWVLRRFR